MCCLGTGSAGGAGGVQKRRAGRDLGALRERLQPLEQLRIGARSSAGGAELLDPVPLRSNRLGLGPLDQHPRCLVAPLTSAHKRAATTLQWRQTLRPEIPADCPVVFPSSLLIQADLGNGGWNSSSSVRRSVQYQ